MCSRSRWAGLGLLAMMVGCFSSATPSTMSANNTDDPYGLCPASDAGVTASGTGNGEMPPSCDAPPPASPLVGWATVPGMGNGGIRSGNVAPKTWRKREG